MARLLVLLFLHSTLALLPQFSCFDDALDSAALPRLVKDCEAVNAWATDSSNGGLMHGKRPTFWYDLEKHGPPRSSIERAIVDLHRLIPTEMLAGNKTALRGAEWWVQVRSKDEGIGFHYDKDEGMASLKGIMVHPSLSTVTYLSDSGAPTLIFDMITPDGNSEIPEIPVDGFLSYPKANRHIIFSGNLQHGVLASAAPQTSTAARRVTLLIK